MPFVCEWPVLPLYYPSPRCTHAYTFSAPWPPLLAQIQVAMRSLQLQSCATFLASAPAGLRPATSFLPFRFAFPLLAAVDLELQLLGLQCLLLFFARLGLGGVLRYKPLTGSLFWYFRSTVLLQYIP